MGIHIDHYVVLGLPSGEQGAKLTEADINKAYKTKALELHPDKRPDDPNATSNFLQLQSSYETLKDKVERKRFDQILKDEIQRKKLDATLRVQRQRQSSQCDSKKRKLVEDLHERERAAFDPDLDRLAREDEEEKYNKEMKESTEKIIGNEMQALDRKKKIKVEFFVEYSAERLKELFGAFGVVEYVVVKKSKNNKWSALLDMASVCEAAAFTPLKVLVIED
ncbi:pre-mRNA-splicing factor cwf23-like [Papaver somniferum]|uniref:pre-mRNA-splicing factor cwf23-like n=1 Tax=Papaver somniferum TaxID=3469 RepID=UPI000E7019C4|nr:pre-mRNA-splicing factor cwf23-like [Papaver somniferum]